MPPSFLLTEFNCLNLEIHPSLPVLFHLQGLNSINLRHNIRQNFHIDEIEGYHCNKKIVLNLLKNMQDSGLFKKIYCKHIICSQYQVIEIELDSYPLLSKIFITTNEQHLIPSIIFKNIFFTQIGLPKNLNQIQQSVQKIKEFYIAIGYKWVSIEIDTDKSIANNLVLNINQGLIEKIDIRYLPNPHSIHEIPEFRNIFLLTLLQIKINSPLNSIHLEQRIAFFKSMKLIENIFYNVIRLPNNKLSIILTIYRLPENNIYILCQNYALIPILEKFIYYFQLMPIKSHILSVFNLIHYSRLSTYNYILDSLEFADLDWYIFYIKYFGFQYTFRQFNTYNTLLLNVQYTESFSLIKLVYQYPWYHIKSHTIIYIYGSIIHQRSYYQNPISKLLYIKKVPMLNFFFYKFILYCYNKSQISLHITCQLKEIIWMNISNIYNPIIDYLTQYYHINHIHLYDIYILYKNLTNITKQYLYISSINLIANNLDNIHTPIKGTYTQLLYVHYISIQNKFKKMHQLHSKLDYHMFFYQDIVHITLQFYKTIHHLILYFYISLNYGSLQLLPMNNRLLVLNSFSWRSYFKKPYLLSPYVWNIELEYIFFTHSLFMFYTFIQHNTSLMSKLDTIISNTSSYNILSQGKQFIDLKIYLGIGVKAYIPLGEIPYIHLEYIIYGPNQYKLYLRF